MKKKLIAIAAACAVLATSAAFAACAPNGEEGTYYTVTYMDGATVLKTERVKEGEKPAGYTPQKDGGYQFVDWFATPSKNHKYDLNAQITGDVTVYAGFTLYKEDTREFYILGSGMSELLFSSNWGKVITDAHKLTKAAGKNEYSITCDLKEGDKFQFALNGDWENKRGFGYLDSLALADGTEVFSGQGSVYDDSAKGSDIVCEYSGNYTLTLKTYPNEDYYNTSGTGYTEERKEVYNLGLYDKIEWVRNGDVVNDSVTITDFYIKGQDITGWADMYNSSTKMTENGGIYTLSVYLKEGDQFMFTSQVTKIENGQTSVSVGSEYIKSNALTSQSRTLVTGYTEAGANMTAAASGTYTFTYDKSAKTLAVEFDAAAIPAECDYYLDGNFNGNNYGAFITSPGQFKLAPAGGDLYVLQSVTLTEGSELLLRSYAKGETADWNHDHEDYQYPHLAANSAFERASEQNANIKVKTAGVYDVTFNCYSKIITITPHIDSADSLDLWVKGEGAGLTWDPNFRAQYRMTLSADQKSYEYTITVTDKVQLGIAKYPKGSQDGYGDYLGRTALGEKGDANALFDPGEGSNFVCSTAGTYKIVYDIETGKVDFYTVQA